MASHTSTSSTTTTCRGRTRILRSTSRRLRRLGGRLGFLRPGQPRATPELQHPATASHRLPRGQVVHGRAPFPAAKVRTTSAAKAYRQVLAGAGERGRTGTPSTRASSGKCGSGPDGSSTTLQRSEAGRSCRQPRPGGHRSGRHARPVGAGARTQARVRRLGRGPGRRRMDQHRGVPHRPHARLRAPTRDPGGRIAPPLRLMA